MYFRCKQFFTISASWHSALIAAVRIFMAYKVEEPLKVLVLWLLLDDFEDLCHYPELIIFICTPSSRRAVKQNRMRSCLIAMDSSILFLLWVQCTSPCFLWAGICTKLCTSKGCLSLRVLLAFGLISFRQWKLSVGFGKYAQQNLCYSFINWGLSLQSNPGPCVFLKNISKCTVFQAD